MSRQDLIQAYVSGRISRRAFLRGMAAVGMSLTTAAALADDLRAAPAPGSPPRGGRDVYGDVYGGVTTLPATGSGDTGGHGGSSAWAKPLAAAGVAAAFAAAKLRKTSSPAPASENETE